MKTLISSIFALALIGATAASADVGVGAHVGGVGAGVHLGVGDHHSGRQHYCNSWRWDHGHHNRSCRHWGWR